MFERFTRRSRNVIALAQEEARALKHDYVGTEHLLLGLLREKAGLAAQLLADRGITAEHVRARVARLTEPPEAAGLGQIRFTPRANHALASARRESLGLCHNYIGTEHLLLGLADDSGGTAARILLEYGADRELLWQEVVQARARRHPQSPVLDPSSAQVPSLPLGPDIHTDRLREMLDRERANDSLSPGDVLAAKEPELRAALQQRVADLLADIEAEVAGVPVGAPGNTEAVAYLSGALTTLARLGLIDQAELRSRRYRLLEAYGYDITPLDRPAAKFGCAAQRFEPQLRS